MGSSLNMVTAISAFGGRRWKPSLLAGLSAMTHAAALVTLAVSPQSWGWALSGLLANHAVLLAATFFPRGTWLGPNLVRLPEAAVRRGEICLTFDDGPDPVLTPAVLDVLEKHHAKASFFCIGRKAESFPDLVREIARRGHSVENHSYGHRYAFALFGMGRLRREIGIAQATVGAITGRAPRFFRAPAGFRSLLLDPVLASLSLRYVSWTRRGFDAVSRDPQRVLDRLRRNLAAGDVLLLHDNAEVVLDVLPRLLDAVGARGLRPVSLAAACGEDAAT